MMNETGCDMVMIGRGALGNPWIFREINGYFSSGLRIMPPPTLAERIVVIKKHMDALCAAKGEGRGMREAEKACGVVHARSARCGGIPAHGGRAGNAQRTSINCSRKCI